MIWALRLLGFGKTLLSWGRSALRWIVSDWRHILIALVSLFAAYQWLEAGKYQRAHERAVTSLERANKTIADMKAASEAAKQAAIANAKRVEAEYERIATDAKNSYDRALADNRASVGRWKLQNRRSATGKGDSTTTATGTEGIAGTEALPNIPSGFALVPESDLDKTADIQATLYALQEWARGIGKVETAPQP